MFEFLYVVCSCAPYESESWPMLYFFRDPNYRLTINLGPQKNTLFISSQKKKSYFYQHANPQSVY